MGILAVISFSLIVYELIIHPSRSVIREFTDIDIVIAVVFLIDYIWLVYHAEFKLQFILVSVAYIYSDSRQLDRDSESLKVIGSSNSFANGRTSIVR